MNSTRPDQTSPAGLLPPEVLTLFLTQVLSATTDPWDRLHQTRAFQLTCVAWSRALPLRTEVVAQGQRAVARLVSTRALTSPLLRRVTIDFGDTTIWSTETSLLFPKLAIDLRVHATVGQREREALVVQAEGEDGGGQEDEGGLDVLDCAMAFSTGAPLVVLLGLVANVKTRTIVLRITPSAQNTAQLIELESLAVCLRTNPAVENVELYGIDFSTPPGATPPAYKALKSFSTDLHSTDDLISVTRLLSASTDSLRTLSLAGGDAPFSPPLRLLPHLITSFTSLTSLTVLSERWDLLGHATLSFDSLLRHMTKLEELTLGYTGYTQAILRTIEDYIPKMRILHLKLYFETPAELLEWVDTEAAECLEELKLGRRITEWSGWGELQKAAHAVDVLLEVFGEDE